jgi:predicted secreted hydrolase
MTTTGLLRRRHLLAAGLLAPLLPAQALPLRTLQFPRDFGSHPDLHTEWWYITGHLATGAREFGFQVTFFRSRVAATQAMQSRFAAKQLLFAHAAITDVRDNKLWHDQRIAREGFGLALADEKDTRLQLRDWSLLRDGSHNPVQYKTSVSGHGFSFSLTLTETQPVLLQGQQGLSRKGPQEQQASYYYSQPQLRAEGSVVIEGKSLPVQGKAWLDHEWSDEMLHPQAVGWDWIGMNLDDGSALTAFRLRDQAGNALWDGGSFRSAGGPATSFNRGEVSFKPVRSWNSALSNASYPVEWVVRTPADVYTVRAVIDNQELDSRASTGAIYWEGLCELIDSHGRRVGHGYLEMTGYAKPLRL